MNRVVFGIALLFATRMALGHDPTISDGTANGPETALHFDDIQVSRVVYHEATEEAQQLWLTFDIDEPQSLVVTLGIPLIDRLAAFRPAVAVLGPGLPDIEVPFEIPQGLGGQLFETDTVRDPEEFHEPFSGTTSWILRREHVDLPEAGTYYLVAYVPSGETGKLWLAPGDREAFTLGLIIELGTVLREIRAFHEVDARRVPCLLFPVAVVALAFLVLRLTQRKSSLPKSFKGYACDDSSSPFAGEYNDVTR